MTPDQIRVLHSLAKQKKTRDMAVLTQQQQKLKQADHVIQTLSEKVDTISKNISAQDLATTAHWLGWASLENSSLLQSRKRLEQSKEVARQTAARSDAKTRVIDAMLNKAETYETFENRRRAERMGREPDK